KNGSGLYFDGSDVAYVAVTDPADGGLDFGTGSFTVSYWYKGQPKGDTQQPVYKGSAPGWRTRVSSSDGSFIFQIRDGTNSEQVENTSVRVDDNQWHHVVGVRDETAEILYLYQDGVLIDTQSISGADAVGDVSNSSDLNFSRDNAGSGVFGIVDQVRLYNYARTPAQIAWEYNRGKPVGWWRLDDNVSGNSQTIHDASGNGNHGTTVSPTDGSLDCTVEGKRNLGCDFDGSEDYVTIPSSDAYSFGTGDFSFSAWIKSTQDCASDWKIYVGRYGPNPSLLLRCEDNGSIGNASFSVRDSDSVSQSVAGTSNITDGNWHHLVGIKEGHSSATLKIYVDGKLENTSAQTYTGNFNYGSQAVNIGRHPNNSRYADAVIDDVRLYNFALTDLQIQGILNDGAVRFGPNTGSP
ncbi:MAG TPA: LamG domain-containing protein, partial [Bacteroidales bacterium]|nr:LamG domain-containing protein [Bacteroidales bacterium]